VHRDSVAGEVDDLLFTGTLASIGCQDEVMDFVDGLTVDRPLKGRLLTKLTNFQKSRESGRRNIDGRFGFPR
jgi:hypothetical protein